MENCRAAMIVEALRNEHTEFRREKYTHVMIGNGPLAWHWRLQIYNDIGL